MRNDGQIYEVIPHLVDGGLSILQYVNDTILFMQNDLEKTKHVTCMKLLLCAFEQLSDLNINFHKSEIFCFGEIKESIARYIELFGCSQGEFPLKYLGFPIHFRKLSNTD